MVCFGYIQVTANGKKTTTPKKQTNKNRKIKLTMTTETENIKTWTTHDPTRKDLIFAPPAFFCFSAIAQMAHLQNRTSRPTTQVLQKSHFLPTLKEHPYKNNRTFATNA